MSLERSAKRRPYYIRVVREDPIDFADDLVDRQNRSWLASDGARKVAALGALLVLWGGAGLVAWVLAKMVQYAR